MKYLHYIYRNARRNPVRSFLTIASVSISLLLMMILVAFFAIDGDVASSLKVYNRIVVMSSQGFAQPVPIALLNQVRAMDGVVAATPFSWYGGKYGQDTIPFAQFGIDAEAFDKVYDDFKIPPDQLKAFQQDRTGAVVGRKLALDKGFKIGDRLPLKGDIYPVDLDLTIRAIYDVQGNQNPRMCMFHWGYLDEQLKKLRSDANGNAGIIVVKCKDAATMPVVIQAIDKSTRNSNTPTRSQTEEAFANMFSEMWGDMKTVIGGVGLAVIVSLVLVAGVAMAMAMRERTTEVAVLKAIGFNKGRVLGLVLAEAMLVAAVGGIIGALGGKAFFDLVDVAPYTGGFLPFFYIPWKTALLGLGMSALIGLLSGLVPAFQAANLSVINGLRKVI